LIDFVQKTTLQTAIISGKQTREWDGPRGQKYWKRKIQKISTKKNARAREASSNCNVVGEAAFALHVSVT